MILAVIEGILAVFGGLCVFSLGISFAWIAFRSRQFRKERRRTFGKPLNSKEQRAWGELESVLREGGE